MSSLFVESLKRMITEPRSRAALLIVLAEFEGTNVYLPKPTKAERRRSAAQIMLDSGWTAPDTAKALCERFSVDLRTAQRDINAAAAKAPNSFVADPV